MLRVAQGEVALAQGRFAEAVAAFRGALDGTSDPSIPRKLAAALEAGGDAEGAEAVLRQALRSGFHGASQVAFYGDLVDLLRRAGRDTEIVELLETATARHPDSAALWFYLGAAQGRLGSLDQALLSYERSVSLAEDPLALKTLAMLVLHLHGDRAASTALLRRSLRANPEQEDVRQLLGLESG